MPEIQSLLIEKKFEIGLEDLQIAIEELVESRIIYKFKRSDPIKYKMNLEYIQDEVKKYYLLDEIILYLRRGFGKLNNKEFSPGVAKNKFNNGMRPDSKKWLLYLKAMVLDNLLSENDSPSASKQKFTLII